MDLNPSLPLSSLVFCPGAHSATKWVPLFVVFFPSQDPSINTSGRGHVTEMYLPNGAASFLGYGKAFCGNGKTK